MFNTEKWSSLIEETYGYKARVYSINSFQFHYNIIHSEIGDYAISPSFGDFINLDRDQLSFLDEFLNHVDSKPALMKLRFNSSSELSHPFIKQAGYLHEIDYSSYKKWTEDGIKCKFRNQINQGKRSGLVIRSSTDEKDLVSFWEMHAKLRLGKFSEIPQPKKFFLNIRKIYFCSEEGFVLNAFDQNNNLVAGILVVISGDTAFYKFSASYPSALKLRPNNYLMDRLIFELDKRGISTLNLGYTGTSEAYAGLRKYKLSAGAREYPRYILKTPSYEKLNRVVLTDINNKVAKLISGKPALGELDIFSQKYYKYFV